MEGNRIKHLRENMHLKQEDLAKVLSVAPSTIGMYELNYREPNNEILLKLSEYFGVTTDYLLGKDDNINNQKKSNAAVVFVYGTIPAGIPMECIEDIIDTEEIPVDMLKGDKQYFGLKIKGNSMFPDYLDGDTIILEKVDDCESGQDCVVMVDGNDGTFKRIFKNEQGIILQPLNPTYSPLVFTNEQIKNLPVKIIGRVVELRRKK